MDAAVRRCGLRRHDGCLRRPGPRAGTHCNGPLALPGCPLGFPPVFRGHSIMDAAVRRRGLNRHDGCLRRPGPRAGTYCNGPLALPGSPLGFPPYLKGLSGMDAAVRRCGVRRHDDGNYLLSDHLRGTRKGSVSRFTQVFPKQPRHSRASLRGPAGILKSKHRQWDSGTPDRRFRGNDGVVSRE